MKTRRDGEVLQQVQHIIRAVAGRSGVGSEREWRGFERLSVLEIAFVAQLNSSFGRTTRATAHQVLSPKSGQRIARGNMGCCSTHRPWGQFATRSVRFSRTASEPSLIDASTPAPAFGAFTRITHPGPKRALFIDVLFGRPQIGRRTFVRGGRPAESFSPNMLSRSVVPYSASSSPERTAHISKVPRPVLRTSPPSGAIYGGAGVT